VFDWFQKRIVVIAGEVKLNQSLTLSMLDEPDGKARLLPFLREADLGVSDLQVKKEPIPPGGSVVLGKPFMVQPTPQGNAMNIVTVTLSHVGEEKEPVTIDFAEESSGTKILFEIAGAWLNVLKNGEILILDEIDAHMHPTLLRFMIGHFQSPITNPNNAQLICSTHNTSILDKAMFRRDQVWFVEKDPSGASKVYPLTDFSPRNDESFERAYMRGRYGAQPILPGKAH
jgi:hypothetical protein